MQMETGCECQTQESGQVQRNGCDFDEEFYYRY
jgi:hypothetical protein